MKVVLDDQSSSKHSINNGVPQDSIIEHTFFLVFTNNNPDHVLSNLGKYANNSTVYSSFECIYYQWDRLGVAAELEDDLRTIAEWGNK